MARPLSEDKRQAILQAATKLFAEEGLGAPTSRIAKAAGVAEGTVFIYFASKDALINQLYLDLKGQLRAVLGTPLDGAAAQDQLRQAWHASVTWGLEHPQEHRALAKLQVSDRVAPATQAEAFEWFHDVAEALRSASADGALRDHPFGFAGAILTAMSDATIDFIRGDPSRAERAREDGFAAFWNAVARP